MQNVTIISHLTAKEWKESWADKVVEDNKENMKATRADDCFWGHFKNEDDFVLCFHKEFEIKGMSMGMYFTGHIEKDSRGCKITGKFGKKLSANLFLGLGAALCLLAFISAMLRGDQQVSLVAAALLVIIILFYMIKPKKGQERLLKHLEKISFDSNFHKKNNKK